MQVISIFIICLFTSYFKTLIYTNIILYYSWIILRLGCLRLTSSGIKPWYKVEVFYWKMCSGGRKERRGGEEEGKSQFAMSPWTSCSNRLFHHIRPLEELYEVNFRTVFLEYKRGRFYPCTRVYHEQKSCPSEHSWFTLEWVSPLQQLYKQRPSWSAVKI